MAESGLKNIRIGIIAGSGQFPLIFLEVAKKKGYSVYAVCLVGEAHPDVARLATKNEWLPLGQVEQMMQFFKKNAVTEAVMIGAVNKTRMFTDIQPDMRAISIVSKMDHTHDDALLRAFAHAMASEGIEIKASTTWVPEMLAKKGCWTKRVPTSDEASDVAVGYRLAKAIGALDIGQSVVIGGGSVLAVEAIDGTDATIKRGGTLAKNGATVVKVSKPNQDMRFDVPSVGLETLKSMISAKCTVLAVEAGKTLVFDEDKMIQLANKENIAIVGVDE